MTTMNQTMNFVATAALSGRGAAEGSGTHNLATTNRSSRRRCRLLHR